MQVTPSTAFLQAISKLSGAVPTAPAQPTAPTPQPATRPRAAQPPAPATPGAQEQIIQHRPNLPRGSFVNIVV